MRDRETEARQVFEHAAHAYLRALVTPEIVDEHRRQPAGHHSPALAQVLAYFRQQPTPGKLAVLAAVPGQQWDVIRLGPLGAPHEVVETGFQREDDALHAVFLRRLAEAGIA
ncbi:MAG: hypothetical protein J2P57_10420 [Acidimicrobiaceae bacterium]|nr:hypothetical protein [Acidimicrobiaceae bacterium]